MRPRRSDLPLEGDASTRFLPWLIALMVYLATLLLAAALAAGGVVERWERGLSGRMSVQVSPPAATAGEGSPDLEARVAAALRVLRETPGVETARRLSEAEMTALLEPWLGGRALAEELPLPALIDVTVDPERPPERDALARQLAAAAPGVRLNGHGRWLGALTGAIRSLQVLAGVLLALVAAAAASTVVFVTRTGLAIHHHVIEVLHLVGAYDSYIARQFQRHALTLALRGGLLGLGLAAVTLLALDRALAGMQGPLVPALALTPAQWGMIAAVPLAAAAVAVATARFTVLRTLARLV